MIVVICVLILILGAWHLFSEKWQKKTSIYISKPLTTFLILLLGVVGVEHNINIPALYGWLIVVGLAFSILGDIFLMLEKDYFIAGLVAFLMAHLCYIVAFYWVLPGLAFWPLIILILYGVLVYSKLHKSLAEMKAPVVVYLCVILVMVWLAWCVWLTNLSIGGLFIFIGALIFAISDTILALGKFVKSGPNTQLWVMATYYVAQALIALSVSYLVI